MKLMCNHCWRVVNLAEPPDKPLRELGCKGCNGVGFTECVWNGSYYQRCFRKRTRRGKRVRCGVCGHVRYANCAYIRRAGFAFHVVGDITIDPERIFRAGTQHCRHHQVEPAPEPGRAFTTFQDEVFGHG